MSEPVAYLQISIDWDHQNPISSWFDVSSMIKPVGATNLFGPNSSLRFNLI